MFRQKSTKLLLLAGVALSLAFSATPSNREFEITKRTNPTMLPSFDTIEINGSEKTLINFEIICHPLKEA